MYKLFILGELLVGEKHGYSLQEILKNAIGPYRQISAGTLYPLLSRMVEKGLIRLRTEGEGTAGRQRKIYSITDEGKDCFLRLMEEPLEFNADTELLFQFKMVYFQYVSKTVRISCMEHYLKYLRHQMKHVADFEFLLEMQKPEPERQRKQLLRVLDHRKRLASADLAWVENELERIRVEE